MSHTSSATPGPIPTAPNLSSRPAGAQLSRLIISAYKLMGFIILTGILAGISAFVATHLLYLVHHGWLIPRVVSPTDPAVLDLQQRLAQETAARSRLQGEQGMLEVRVRSAQRVSQVEQEFQTGFSQAIASDASVGRETIEALEQMRSELARIQRELGTLEGEVRPRSVESLRRDLDARLIDEQRFARESYQLAQLARDRFQLREREAELTERIRQAQHGLSAVNAVSRSTKSVGTGGYEPLLRRREHARSQLSSQNADDEALALRAGAQRLEQAVAEHDALIATLKASPLLRATTERVHLAFVPYDNQESIRVGASVYACRLGFVVCHEVGHVQRYLEGEQTQEHPVYGRPLRGQWVELSLDEPEAIQHGVLHAGHKPLYF